MFFRHSSEASRGFRVPLFIAAVALLAAWVPAAPGLAHEGHDHGPAEAQAEEPAAPRVAAYSDAYELVGVLRGDRLVIYLDRFATNEPVTSAKVVVTIGDATTPSNAEPAPDGTYVLSSPSLRAGGQVELVFAISEESGVDDLLAGVMTLPGNAAGRGAGAATLMTAWRRVASLFSIGRADNGEALRAQSKAAPGALVDTPRRRADGHVFAPKPTQRLLDVRTEQLAPRPAQRTATLIGRTIADPNRTSLVQSISGGRVVAPGPGLPRIGQAVKKGDVLASIEPTVPQADRTTILEKQGEVEQLIAVAESKLRRLRILLEKQVAAQSAVTDAEVELEGLRRRQQVLRDMRIEPETLRAQTDGVIAVARVVAGQVVQAQDLLFQIVDPASMWIEALVYGELDPAALGAATATAAGHASLKLRFQGFSRNLQQHAAIIQFAVENPPVNLSTGLPVTVHAPAGEAKDALIVPKDVVVRGSNGQQIVWVHEQAELFEPRQVRVAPFDAGRVIVAAGVAKGDRVVVRGAELVNQVR